MGGEKTARVNRKSSREKQKYQVDTKCSIDVGAKNRQKSEDGGGGHSGIAKPGPARTTGFQKGGAAAQSHSQENTQKDAKARACSLWMDKVIAAGVHDLRLEFIQKVKKYVPKNPEVTVFNKFEEYNRYADVTCLDKTRVVLKNHPDKEDYIHASYVTINPDLVYICTQGPLSDTVVHFWLMVMQEKSKVILQLCKLREPVGDEEKEKCNEYYPPVEEGKEWKTYGCVQVRVLDRATNLAGLKKVIKSKMEVKMEDSEKVHTVTHIYYYGWPDHAPAESVGTCREVRSLVHKHYEKKPIVAHCSAGIGRTGSFVMIDMVCDRLLNKHDGEFKMFQIARELRDQRSMCIQNDQQYLYIFRCVIDILLREDAIQKTKDVAKFIESYDSFIQRKQGGKK